MIQEFSTSNLYRGIYLVNSLVLILGVMSLYQGFMKPLTDQIVLGVLFTLYGSLFAWFSYRTLFFSKIYINGDTLVDRHFLRKPAIFSPLTKYSATMTNRDRVIILEKDGVKKGISTNHLTKKEALYVYDFLSNVCKSNPNK